MKPYLKTVHAHRATLGLRFANYLIDTFVIFSLFFFLGVFSVLLYTFLDIKLFYNWVTYLENMSRLEDIIITAITTLIYYFTMEYFTKGRTIGKWITGTKVISIDGKTPDAKQLFYRTLSRIVPFDGLSFLFSENGWHDQWSDTRVIKIKSYHRSITSKTEIDNIGKKDA